MCTSNVQLLDETEKALHGTLSNERLFCNEVNLNTASLNEDVQSLADCQSQFFVEAEDCARPFRDNFKTTTAAERISDQTCRFVLSKKERKRERRRLREIFVYRYSIVISKQSCRATQIQTLLPTRTYRNGVKWSQEKIT